MHHSGFREQQQGTTDHMAGADIDPPPPYNKAKNTQLYSDHSRKLATENIKLCNCLCYRWDMTSTVKQWHILRVMQIKTDSQRKVGQKQDQRQLHNGIIADVEMLQLQIRKIRLHGKCGSNTWWSPEARGQAATTAPSAPQGTRCCNRDTAKRHVTARQCIKACYNQMLL